MIPSILLWVLTACFFVSGVALGGVGIWRESMTGEPSGLWATFWSVILLVLCGVLGTVAAKFEAEEIQEKLAKQKANAE